MRTISFALLLIGLLSSSLHAQTAQEILSKAYSSCQSIKSGSYSMIVKRKFMTKKDTAVTRVNTTFMKQSGDSLFPCLFHSTESHSDGTNLEFFYSGKEFVRKFIRDSSAQSMSTARWSNMIQAIKHNFMFFKPLTDTGSAPLPHTNNFTDSLYSYTFRGTDSLESIPCYKVDVTYLPKYDSTNMFHVLRIDYEFWIRSDSYLPLRYTINHDVIMNNDSMHQHESFTLITSSLNIPVDTTAFTLACLPATFKLKEFAQPQREQLLPEGNVAPDWTLMTTEGQPLSLQHLKGRIVLLDFFYRSCAPCMMAIPGLRALQDKYAAHGLSIIGVDPYDKNDNDFQGFLRKQNVSYPVVTDASEVSKSYRISGYPTIYLLDRQGKVLHTQVGYSKDHEAALEEIIEKNLGEK